MAAVRFHAGWQRRWRQGLFALSCFKYLRRGKYPLFSVRGISRLPRVAKMLALEKLPEFNGAYFPSLTLPHRPSRAFDHMVARGGLNVEAAGTPARKQVGIVLMAITRRCEFRCAHCYERFNLGTEEAVPVQRWQQVLREVQHVGAGIVAFSGGEPMLRYDALLSLLESGNKDLSDFHVHTSGLGVTPARARELGAAGLTAAAVGLDDARADRNDALRWPGTFEHAIGALRAFRDAGVFTYTNLCLTPELVRSGKLWAYYELARELGVGFIEMLEPRPCGGYASDTPAAALSADDRRAATEFFLEGNTSRKYRDYPVISYVAYNEAPERLGCGMGGLMQLYIDSRGHVNPCVFLPVAFGNIMREEFGTIFARVRAAVPRPLREPCPAVTLSPALCAASATTGWPVPYEAFAEQWRALVHRT